MDYSNLFYYNHNDNTRQKNDFDSYSKTSDDIIKFYLEKFHVVESRYRNDFIFSIGQLNNIANINQEDDFIKLILNKSKPFELYVIGTILFTENKIDWALKCYYKEIQLPPCSRGRAVRPCSRGQPAPTFRTCRPCAVKTKYEVKVKPITTQSH